jgi:hypothetical protein
VRDFFLCGWLIYFYDCAQGGWNTKLKLEHRRGEWICQTADT